jgi:Raf kinase inhibitor-like YbhB/YbcL family protein
MTMIQFERFALALLLCAATVTGLSAQAGGGAAPAGGGAGRAGDGGGGGAPLVLTTTAFTDGGTIPIKFTQAAPGVATGEGTSPALSWTGGPATGVVSYVLHMHDAEVSRNRTTDDQLHWLVWNLPASVTSLAEGLPKGEKLPNGAYQISATGQVYRGPGAPANGPPHHYTFELYALDIAIDVPPTADAFETRTKVIAAMQGHIVGKAVLVGLFKRPS